MARSTHRHIERTSDPSMLTSFAGTTGALYFMAAGDQGLYLHFRFKLRTAFL